MAAVASVSGTNVRVSALSVSIKFAWRAWSAYGRLMAVRSPHAQVLRGLVSHVGAEHPHTKRAAAGRGRVKLLAWLFCSISLPSQ